MTPVWLGTWIVLGVLLSLATGIMRWIPQALSGCIAAQGVFGFGLLGLAIIGDRLLTGGE